MNGRAYYYDVTQGDRVILERATAGEVAKELNINHGIARSISRYAMNGNLINGKYGVRISGESEKNKIDDDDMQKRFYAVNKKFSLKMFEEWVAMNQRYGKVVMKNDGTGKESIQGKAAPI